MRVMLVVPAQLARIQFEQMASPITIKVRGIKGVSFGNRLIDTGARNAILRAGAAVLKLDTVFNFGTSGTGRPSTWPKLTPKYARRVKRGVATLDLSGDLMRSIRISQPNGDSITVYTDDKKAEAHQFGNPKKNIPARPFFPIDRAGNLTQRAQRRVETAMQLESERLLRGQVK